MFSKEISLCLRSAGKIKNLRSFFVISQNINTIGYQSTKYRPGVYSERLKLLENRLVGLTATSRQYTAAGIKLDTSAKKKMTKLTEQQRVELLKPLFDVGWTVVDNRDAIYKEFVFKDFNEAFSFISGVALLAEKINHHPELFNVYNKVQITLSTHDVDGLSTRDIRMAKYMEEQSKRFL